MPKITAEELVEIEERTRSIEASKEAKRAEREAKKQQKLDQKKSEFKQRLVAPILLVITVLLSLFMYVIYQ